MTGTSREHRGIANVFPTCTDNDCWCHDPAKNPAHPRNSIAPEPGAKPRDLQSLCDRLAEVFNLDDTPEELSTEAREAIEELWESRDAWMKWATHVQECTDCHVGDYCQEGRALKIAAGPSITQPEPTRCTCRDFPGADEFCMAHKVPEGYGQPPTKEALRTDGTNDKGEKHEG